MTASQIADIVRAYTARTSATFETENGVDIVLDAINNAKRWAIKQEPRWYYLRQQVNVTVPTTGLDVTLEVNGSFNVIDEVWETDTSGGLGCRAEFRTQAQLNGEQETVFNENTTPIYQLGKTLYVNNATSDTDLILIGYKYLPDYVTGSVEEDMFTEYGSDYLKAHALKSLQIFKKDDQRAYITNAQVNEEFRALLLWNSNLIKGNQTWDLS